MSNKRSASLTRLEPFVHGLGKAILRELIEEALAEQEQEPVAFRRKAANGIAASQWFDIADPLLVEWSANPEIDLEYAYTHPAPANQKAGDTEQSFKNGYDTGYEAGKLHATQQASVPDGWIEMLESLRLRFSDVIYEKAGPSVAHDFEMVIASVLAAAPEAPSQQELLNRVDELEVALEDESLVTKTYESRIAELVAQLAQAKSLALQQADMVEKCMVAMNKNADLGELAETRVKELEAMLAAAPEAPANQPSVPDKLTVSMAPTSQYAQGWNDCVDAMLAAAPEAPAPAQWQELGEEEVIDALHEDGCERIGNLYLVGPVQKAAVFSFADAISAALRAKNGAAK